MTDTLLIGVDGSEDASRAVEFAAARAESSGARLIVAHVIEWSPYTFNTPEENETRHKRREEEIETSRSRSLELGVPDQGIPLHHDQQRQCSRLQISRKVLPMKLGLMHAQVLIPTM